MSERLIDLRKELERTRAAAYQAVDDHIVGMRNAPLKRLTRLLMKGKAFQGLIACENLPRETSNDETDHEALFEFYSRLLEKSEK